MRLTESEWLFLNDIVLKIHTTEDLSEMRKGFLTYMQLLIPSDFSATFLRDETGCHSVSHPIGLNIQPSRLEEYAELEKIDFFKWIFSYTESRVYRRSDFFSDEAMEGTSYYKLAYEPLGFYHGMVIVLCRESTFLGTVSFYRRKKGLNFSERDIFIMDILKDHLSARLYREFSKTPERQQEAAGHNLISLAERYGLTKREVEVLGLWHSGMTDKEMCQRLYISENTLKKHIMNMYKKMGINSRIELLKLFQ